MMARRWAEIMDIRDIEGGADDKVPLRALTGIGRLTVRGRHLPISRAWPASERLGTFVVRGADWQIAFFPQSGQCLFLDRPFSPRLEETQPRGASSGHRNHI
jgi:hypothetical protein